MSLFTSAREKRLWTWTLVSLAAIYATLAFPRSLVGTLLDSNLISNGFWIGMLLVGLTVLVHGIRRGAGKVEIVVGLGIAAVYLLGLMRMASPEARSHMIEYGVVAVFIFEAFKERSRQGRPLSRPALWAILLTTLLGILDESIQIFLPNRIFDLFDILFDALAAIMAVSASLALTWTHKRLTR